MILTKKTNPPPFHKIRTLKRIIKSFLLVMLVLSGLSLIVASGGGGGGSASGTSSGTISGSAS